MTSSSRLSILLAILATPLAGQAGPGDDGQAAGRAALPVLNGMINAPTAAATVPSATTAPPQAAYYGTNNLAPAGNAQLAACATRPSDRRDLSGH